jgi:hypothetical protein
MPWRSGPCLYDDAATLFAGAITLQGYHPGRADKAAAIPQQVSITEPSQLLRKTLPRASQA